MAAVRSTKQRAARTRVIPIFMREDRAYALVDVPPIGARGWPVDRRVHRAIPLLCVRCGAPPSGGEIEAYTTDDAAPERPLRRGHVRYVLAALCPTCAADPPWLSDALVEASILAGTRP